MVLSMETTDAHLLVAISTDDGRDQARYFIQPSLPAKTCATNLQKRGRYRSSATFMVIRERKTSSCMAATCPMLQKKQESHLSILHLQGLKIWQPKEQGVDRENGYL
jgi:hypothetical protein